MPYDGDCATCHNQTDPGADRTALFSQYKAGNVDAFLPTGAVFEDLGMPPAPVSRISI